MFKIIVLKIGIDAKRAFTNYSGLGNYSRDVINSLCKFNNLDLHLFTTKKNISIYKKPDNSKIHIPKNYLLKNYFDRAIFIYNTENKSDSGVVICKNQTCSNKISSINEINDYLKEISNKNDK